MGFLDSMLGELVRRETGFNATRLIRRIGSKRLLMMGGAALAGGVLAQKAGQGNLGGSGAGGFGSAMFGGGSSRAPGGSGASGSLPSGGQLSGAQQGGGGLPGAKTGASLPPLPGSSGLGLPPVPSGDETLPKLPGSGESEDLEHSEPASQELLYAIVRTMVSAALSDGALAKEEKAAIEQHLGDSGLSDRQQAQVRRDLVIPAAPAELAGMLPEGEDPEVLLEFAVLVLRADGVLEDGEMRWLESLAGLFGVDEERRTELVKELAGDLFSY